MITHINHGLSHAYYSTVFGDKMTIIIIITNVMYHLRPSIVRILKFMWWMKMALDSKVPLPNYIVLQPYTIPVL